jgi:hypothetical protein
VNRSIDIASKSSSVGIAPYLVRAMIPALSLALCSCPGSVDPDRRWDAAKPIANPDVAPLLDQSGEAGRDSTNNTNSGAICSTAKPCKAAGEQCLVIQGVSSGMCLSACSVAGALCPTPNVQTQRVTCVFQMAGALFCGFICEINGVTYKCPNDTDYDCTAMGSTSGVKVCIPKK